MCGVSGVEFIVIVVVAIVIMDPAKLPEMMRQAGRLAREVRRLRGDLGDIGRELQRHGSIADLKSSLVDDPELARARDRAREVEAEIDALRSRLRRAAEEPAGEEVIGALLPSGGVPSRAEVAPGAGRVAEGPGAARSSEVAALATDRVDAAGEERG